ncbi:MAG: hypothetical protein EXS42_06525 [Lacunisphaera sp.]|nr:hypothetical protein [Lacunisphaera sp.]
MNLKRHCMNLSGLFVLALFLLNPLCAAENSSDGEKSAETIVTGRIKNAVTDKYLSRARVSVRGTELTAFTDQFGVYRLVGVPVGPSTLTVFYTDLDPKDVAIDVTAGSTIQQDINLTSASRYLTKDGEVLEMNPFVVSANRETDADAIATNEQRFSANIKNVISTDAMGDIVGSNAGEFLKYLPGLVAEYDNAEIGGISIRGIGADMTAIYVVGNPISTGNQSGPGRQVEMKTLALNNVSRIEVTKVPTPATPADSLAGSVNMVSKSAFERSGAELQFGVNLTGNGNALTLKKTPHGYLDEKTHKILPGFDFDYTLPIGKNFGIVLTGMESNKFNTQNLIQTAWNAGGTGTNASFSQPYSR